MLQLSPDTFLFQAAESDWQLSHIPVLKFLNLEIIK